MLVYKSFLFLLFSCFSCPVAQGSVEAAAESRRREAQAAERLATEAAEVKKSLSDSGGKQRGDVSDFFSSFALSRLTPSLKLLDAVGCDLTVVQTQVTTRKKARSASYA